MGLKSGVLGIIKANHEYHSEKYTSAFSKCYTSGYNQNQMQHAWKELEVALTNVTRQKHNLLLVPDILVRKMLAINPYHITNKTATVEL